MRRRNSAIAIAQPDPSELAMKNVEHAIDDILSLVNKNLNHLSFEVKFEFGGDGRLIAHLIPKSQEGRALLTRAVAKSMSS